MQEFGVGQGELLVQIHKTGPAQNLRVPRKVKDKHSIVNRCTG